MYNPELLDKERVLAITKCDMLDEQLISEMTDEIVSNGIIDIPFTFISSVAGMNIVELKDMVWKALH